MVIFVAVSKFIIHCILAMFLASQLKLVRVRVHWWLFEWYSYIMNDRVIRHRTGQETRLPVTLALITRKFMHSTTLHLVTPGNWHGLILHALHAHSYNWNPPFQIPGSAIAHYAWFSHGGSRMCSWCIAGPFCDLGMKLYMWFGQNKPTFSCSYLVFLLLE